MENKLSDIKKITAVLLNIEKAALRSDSDHISSKSDVFLLVSQFNVLIRMIASKEDIEELNEFKNNIASAEESIPSEVFHKWILQYKKVISKAVINHELELSGDEIFRDLNKYGADDQILSIAYIYISEIFSDKDPEQSYRYGIKAFETDPDVLKAFDIDKRFEIDKIANSFTDNCPICDSADTYAFKNIKQFNAVNDQSCFYPYKLWKKCNCCKNLFAYNFPVNEMKNINGHYTRSQKEEYICPDKCLYIYSDIFNKCKHYTDGNKYLEIGIGNGEMLATALEFNFDVTAIEICKEDCEKISSVLDLDIIWSDFLKVDLKEKYDIIIMGDVLEHVSAPLDAITKAKDLLSDNGVLWISTPNYESAFTRLMKDHDPMWNQLNHYTYFSYKGFEDIINKLDLEVVHYDVSKRYNGSMELYIRKISTERSSGI